LSILYVFFLFFNNFFQFTCEFVPYTQSQVYYDATISTVDFTFPYFTTLLPTHLMLNEWDSAISSDVAQSLANNALFAYGSTASIAKLRGKWPTMYPASPYRNTYANFTGPILMMNGDLDPLSPLSAAQNYSARYTGPHQTFITMPGVSNNLILFSTVKNSNITCGLSLAAQFLSCPTCTLDTSCLSQLTGFSIDGDLVMSNIIFRGNIWTLQYYQNISASNWTFGILYLIPFALSTLVLIFMVVFYKSRRVRSRLIGPIFGQLFIICMSVMRSVTIFYDHFAPYSYFAFIIAYPLL
jgi:hypothetical protein